MSGVFDPLGRDLFEVSVTKSYRIIFTIVENADLL